VKTLYLIRHAKSDWQTPAAGSPAAGTPAAGTPAAGTPAAADHERPLNRRGVKTAKLMGSFLTALGQEPDAVVASSAVRARTTVELMVEAGNWTCPVRVTRAFYESRPEAVLQELASESEKYASLLVAGHEPAWSELVRRLCGGRVKMATAAIARLDFDVASWSEVEPGGGLMVWFVPPKLLLGSGWGTG